jgi:hypothetical protein
MGNLLIANCCPGLIRSALRQGAGCVVNCRSAQGIAAEIPQDLHGQIRGIGAESPVFLPPGIAQQFPEAKKCAKTTNMTEKKVNAGALVSY